MRVKFPMYQRNFLILIKLVLEVLCHYLQKWLTLYCVNLASCVYDINSIKVKEELFDHHHDHVDDVGAVRKSLWKSLLEIFCE